MQKYNHIIFLNSIDTTRDEGIGGRSFVEEVISRVSWSSNFMIKKSLSETI